MLEEVLGSIHNWFERSVLYGEFAVADGSIALPEDFLQDGQHLRIEGSVFNDGLHQWPVSDLRDEEFQGAVWALAVPRAVQDLAEEIAAWCADNPDSPFVSESFGGYSYTKATGPSGQAASWRDVFRSRLDRWRKLP